ncbi:hypothetical protein F0562_013675 [Nyssa sinensis]|uniref:Uncharacterized protein n=1 Tax=Nyssa sinensis TaxID=561372 RepID=A0A5J4ZLE9_9ASTE|nr:hypothetical protein F0562_013675 [Nyssa sinensis]
MEEQERQWRWQPQRQRQRLWRRLQRRWRQEQRQEQRQRQRWQKQWQRQRQESNYSNCLQSEPPISSSSILSFTFKDSLVKHESTRVRSWRQKAIFQFTQQSLPACKPILTPAWVIATFFLLGVIFIPVGLFSLHASQSVVEIVDRYDTECIPKPFKSNKVAYIKDSSIPKICSRLLKVPKHMKAPIYIYYELDNYYQNHRRYVKSRSDQQLLHGLKYNDTSSCRPEESNKGLPIVPCGLIAWSLFNDTFTFSRGTEGLRVNRKNIAWKSDRDHKFGKQVYPFNFQNGSLIGGGKLDPNIPVLI